MFDVAESCCISYNRRLFFGSPTLQNIEHGVPKTAISVAVNEWISYTEFRYKNMSSTRIAKR